MIHRTSRRDFLATAAAGLGAAALPGTLHGAAPRGAARPFRFAHMTDTHIRRPESPEDTAAVLGHLKRLEPPPEFIIVSGDLTDFGLIEELTLYLETFEAHRGGIPVYHQPGNHDSRWTNGAKRMFERVVGPTRQAFTAHGVHFVLMDSSMLLEQYGHLGGVQLDWLSRELEALPDGTPVVLSMHHPPFVTEEIRNDRYVGDEFELLQRLEGHNVVAILCGHLHQAFDVTVNGFALMTAPAVIGSRVGRVFDVGEHDLTVTQFRIGEARTREIWRVPLRRRAAAPVAIAAPREDAAAPRPVSVFVHTSPQREVVTFLGSSAPEAMHRDGRGWAHTFATAAGGVHRLTVRSGDARAKEYVYRTVRFDTADSAVLWAHQTGGAVQSSPVVADGRVVFGSNDACVHCLDARTGEPLWRFATGGEVVSTPAVVDGVVFFGSTDANVYAVRLTDGEEVWRAATGEAIVASPRVAGGKVLIGSGDFHLHCLDARTGEPLWRFATERGLIKHRPAVADGTAYFGSWDRHFCAVDVGTGEAVWRRPLSASMLYAPATSDPVIFGDLVIFVTHGYTTWALDRHTGEPVWKTESGARRKPSYSSGALVGDRIIYGSITGHALALEAATGREIWNTQAGATPEPLFDSSPCVAGPHAFMGSVHGNLWGFNVETGQIAFRQALGGSQIFSSPAVEDRRLYIGCNDGRLWCVGLA